jgi:hypothetical protein
VAPSATTAAASTTPSTAAATTATTAVVAVVVLRQARLLLGIGEHALERFLGATVQFLIADVRVGLAFSHEWKSSSLSL